MRKQISNQKISVEVEFMHIFSTTEYTEYTEKEGLIIPCVILTNKAQI